MISTAAKRTTTKTPAVDRAAERREKACQEFAALLSAVAVRGFHGTATIAVSLQDGHIQNLRVTTERLVR